MGDLGISSSQLATALLGSAGHQKLVFDIGTLWTSDGTTGGTTKLGDMQARAGEIQFDMTTSRSYLPVAGGRVVFSDFNTVWSSDGTVNGTINLTQSNQKLRHAGLPGGVVQVGEKFLFTQYTSAGTTLWATDGTVQGTLQLLKFDVALGNATGQIVYGLQPAGDHVYAIENFGDGQGNITAQTLWASDGTIAGSGKLITFNGNSYLGEIGSVANSALQCR